MNKLRLGIGIAAVLIALGRIYITLEGRSPGESLSAFGIATGVVFAALGAWFIVSAKGAR